jgi:ferritin-like metal-binding protein YciE
MPIRTPDELLIQEAREIYSAEKQLSRQLPKMIKAVQNETLRRKLEERREHGATLLEQMDQAFEELGSSPGRKKNEVVEGFISDINEHMEEIQNPAMKDAVLLGATQMIEHYCIAAWGTTAAYARVLGKKRYVKAMEGALKIGKRYDDEMTELAEREVNPAMVQPQGEEAPSKSASKKK